MIDISLDSIPRLIGLWRRAAVYRGRGRDARSGASLGRFQGRTCTWWWLNFLPKKSSFFFQRGVFCVCLPWVLRGRFPQCHHHWESSGGPYTFDSSLAESQRMSVGNPDSSTQVWSTRAKPMFSPPSQCGNSLGWKHQWGVRSLWGEAHLMWVGHSTTPKPHAGPGAAWMLPPANRLIGGLQHPWGPPLSGGGPLTTYHKVSTPSTSGGVQSFPSPHGSTCGSGWRDLVVLALIGVRTRISWQGDRQGS